MMDKMVAVLAYIRTTSNLDLGSNLFVPSFNMSQILEYSAKKILPSGQKIVKLWNCTNIFSQGEGHTNIFQNSLNFNYA